MRILVIGATGRIGRQVVERALGHGHEVRAFVHRAGPPAPASGLEVVAGDALLFDDVDAAMSGVDAVIVAVSRGARSGPVHEPIAANVVHAMAVHDVHRLAVVSAAGAFARGDRSLSLPFRAMIRTSLASIYDDLEGMETRVAASRHDWTIVRPSGLTDGPATGRYRFTLDGGIPRHPERISRADVAAVLVKSVETLMYVRRRIVVCG